MRTLMREELRFGAASCSISKYFYPCLVTFSSLRADVGQTISDDSHNLYCPTQIPRNSRYSHQKTLRCGLPTQILE